LRRAIFIIVLHTAVFQDTSQYAIQLALTVYSQSSLRKSSRFLSYARPAADGWPLYG